MADLADLKQFGEELVPLVKQLFGLLGLNASKTDKQAENRALARLKKLVEEADIPTEASLDQRVEAIGANRRVLSEILIQDAINGQALESVQRRLVETQRNALAASFGRLVERATFATIPTLLSATELEQINTHLDGARAEIDQRRRAKKLLDTIVDLAVTGAQIAGKLA